MSHHNHPDIFANLRVVRLEAFANICANEYIFIRRISLYHKPVDDDFGFRVKYVMYFELSEISKTEGYTEYDEQWIKTLEEPNGIISALATTENAFKEVYKHNSKDNFIDEWRFVTKLPEGIDKNYSWILFSRTDKEKTTEQDLIEEVDPSIKNKKNTFRPTIKIVF